jgi:hypothetical protein
MQLTDDEQARVDGAVAKLPKTFVPLEGDAVPLGPNLLISSGYDVPGNRSTAILFNDAGEILHVFNLVELYSLKNTGHIPTSVPIPSAFDERGRLWLADWVHELS